MTCCYIQTKLTAVPRQGSTLASVQTPKTGRRGAVQLSAVRARAICAPARLWGACFRLVVWRGETPGRGAILLRSGEVKRASAFAHTCLHVLRYGRPHSRTDVAPVTDLGPAPGQAGAGQDARAHGQGGGGWRAPGPGAREVVSGGVRAKRLRRTRAG